MSGIVSGIVTSDYVERCALRNRPVETLIEGILAQPLAEVGEGATGERLKEIETAPRT
ncbi:MAG: hypothetical protein WBE46_05575 [Dehalococcoidia bacterium]